MPCSIAATGVALILAMPLWLMACHETTDLRGPARGPAIGNVSAQGKTRPAWRFVDGEAEPLG